MDMLQIWQQINESTAIIFHVQEEIQSTIQKLFITWTGV